MLMDWSEWVVVFVLIMVIIGPQRMPEYAAKLARGIRSFRIMADGAKAQGADGARVRRHQLAAVRPAPI